MGCSAVAFWPREHRYHSSGGRDAEGSFPVLTVCGDSLKIREGLSAKTIPAILVRRDLPLRVIGRSTQRALSGIFADDGLERLKEPEVRTFPFPWFFTYQSRKQKRSF